MQNLPFAFNFLTCALLTLMFGSVANAQPSRTWVSGVGDDMNPCSRTAPCRTFQVAHDRTAAGGEINCVDSGDFGQVNISKSITLDCGRAFGAIHAGSSAIFIAANAASDVVTIRNITIDGELNAMHGIAYGAARTVHLEHITVSTVSFGVLMGGGTESAPGQLTIEDSTFADCVFGINIFTPNSSTFTVDIHNVRITNSILAGIKASNGSRVHVRDSVISMNAIGIDQTDNGVAGSTVLITGSTLALNGIALQSTSGAFLGASGNTFSNNTMTVYNPNGGQIYTGNDNVLFGNAATGSASGVLPKD